MTRNSAPTRSDINRLKQDIEALAESQAATQKELAIQFQRIAELQAEIDVIRGAWSRIKRKTAKKARSR